MTTFLGLLNRFRAALRFVTAFAVTGVAFVFSAVAAEKDPSSGSDEGEPPNRAIVIGIVELAPFAFAGPSPGGFLVEAWRLAAEGAGVEVTFHVAPEAEIMDGLETGSIDMHGGLMLGAGARGLTLGRPVAVQCQGLFTVDASLAYEGWSGERLAMAPQLAQTDLRQRFDAEIVEVADLDSAVGALAEGRVDLVMGPSQAIGQALQGLGLATEQRAMHCPWMVPAAPPHHAATMRLLRRGFDELAPGMLRDLEAKWRAPSAPPIVAWQSEFSDEEIAWLADHASVRLGAAPWVPMTEIDGEGRWTGLGLETVRTVFRKVGVLPIFSGEEDWIQVVAAAKSGHFDGLGYTRPDAEKRRYLAFTETLVSPVYVIANRIDAPFLGGLEDMAGARLAVIRHYAIVSWLEQNHPEIELVQVRDAASGLTSLAAGDVEAYIDILPAVAQMTHRLGLKNVKLATRLQISSSMAIGVRREWLPLRALLDRSIASTGEAELQRIYEDWVRIRPQRAPSKSEIWRAAVWLVSPLLLVLAFIGYRLFQQRRRVLAAKKDLERQVVQLQKLEALGTLSKGISHEFNNILQAILGYADIAAEPENEGEREHSIERIVHSAHRAQEIVGQIRAFSRRQSVEKERVDLGLLVSDSSRLLRASLSATIDIRLHLGEESAFVLGDPGQLRQVLMNLVTNASEAMPDGGPLEISLGPLDDVGAVRVTTGSLALGAYWRLAVCDQGRGIPTELLNKIFDPFFTTRAFGESSGLGLSVVHGIVNAHGGGIRVTSAPSQGSCFEVFLPRAEELGEAMPMGSRPPATSTGRRLNILVVDDEIFLTDIVERCLVRGGYDAEIFNDSSGAFEAFSEDPSGYDLILSDLNMPQLTGEQLAERATSVRPDIPVIVMTGYSSRVLSEPLARGTIRQVLEKPVRPSELLDAISRQLAG